MPCRIQLDDLAGVPAPTWPNYWQPDRDLAGQVMGGVVVSLGPARRDVLLSR